jgi:UDP-N-acetylglucosamine:LPS N-acetylglucosamine transferase
MLNIVQTVYHLVVYMQSNQIHNVLMIEFIHNIYQLYSVSDLIVPYSGASFKLYERIGMW